MKKGQISIFIIVVLVIVGIISIFFFFKSKAGLDIPSSDLKTNEVKSYVDDCLRDVSYQGILFIASRGGYFNLPDIYFDKIPATAYYLYNGIDESPDTIIIEKELSKYLEKQLQYCLDNNEFQDVIVDFSEKKANIKLEKDKIVDNLKMKTIIKKQNSEIILENYEIYINDDKLIRAKMTSKEILGEIKKEPGTLPLTSIFKASDKNNFNLFIDTFDEYNYVFQLKDKNDENFLFNFAIQIGGQNEV